MPHRLPWTVDDIRPQAGRRFLITGANSGIGYHTAAELARHGATVLLAARDHTRGEAALARLRQEASGPGSAAAAAQLVPLDLASLSSVQQLAEELLRRGEPLHGLILNAGVWEPPTRMETTDGFELQFGTNVLGHFALTARLLPLLESACSNDIQQAPRVVAVASIAHKMGRIDFDDLQAASQYNARKSYAQSKLANLMLSLELDRRLRGAGAGIVSVAAHPGVADTNLFKVGQFGLVERTLRHLGGRMIGALLNTDIDGALPTLYAAVAPAAEPGGYYGPQGLLEARGRDVGPAEIRPQARDEAMAGRLWQMCEQLTGTGLQPRACATHS